MPLPVIERRKGRLGLDGALAVVAVAGLLAAGLGVLGGRPGPSPSGPLGVVRPTTPAPAGPAPTPRVGPTPLVTPFVECGAPPTTAPVVQLQVNGRPVAGSVEVLRSGVDPSPALADLDEGTEVPVDVISELWIVGGACANAWDVGLIAGDTLNQVVNPTLDPAIAAQNRFGVALAPYGGRDAILRADLYFPGLAVRALWRISVEPFERPLASLRGEDDPRMIIEGCDVEIVLGNGYAYPRPPTCIDDLPFGPADTLTVKRGESLEFGLGDWDVTNAVLGCGRLSGTSFVGDPEPGCFREVSGRSAQGRSITLPALPADLAEGTWTLAISACALSGVLVVTNSICGTWYANVEVRD